MERRRVAGVDGFRGGWVVAVCGAGPRPFGSDLQLTLSETFADVMAIANDCVAVGVDMPTALPVSGTRASDAELKAYLGSSGRSLFWTPTRDAISQSSHADAVRVNKAAGGKGPSAQGWGLSARIREVRAILLGDQPFAAQDRGSDGQLTGPLVFETHPESSFTAMNGDVPLPSKKSGVGIAQRIKHVQAWAPGIVDVMAAVDPGPVADDLLDACAAAWSAYRVATGTARWFGDLAADGTPAVDDQGLVTAAAI